MPNHIYVGIDSCRKGWCYTSSTDRSGCETGVVPDIASIWRNFDKAALILIDIPIGLPSITHKKEARDIGKKVNNFSEKGQAGHGLGGKSSLLRFFPIKPFFLPQSAC